MTITEIKERIEKNLGNGTDAKVEGLEGTTDHVQAFIVSPRFEKLSLVEAHRLVMGLFQEEIASNELHAFTFKTFTPEEWKRRTGIASPMR